MAMLCAWAAARAQVSPLLIDIQQRLLPTAAERREIYVSSPAAMWHLDTLSLARFGVGFDYLNADEAQIVQDGTGHTAFGVEAEAYKRLDAKIVAWGGAWYASTARRNVRWADCIDYDYVAPYVLGDEKGGDLRSNRYKFRGGVATKIAAWTLGAQLDYRGEIAYRNVDPRVKAIVSDLRVTVGAVRSMSDRWLAGVSASISRYDQNCDIDFYNPINDINTLPLTGLGTWYQRFAGNTNKGSGHEAMGWSVSAQAISLGDGGVSIAYNRYRMHQRLRDFNNIVLGYADNDIFTARACYAWRPSSSLAVMPAMVCALRRRHGTENLFGQAVGNSYDKIGARPNYRHDRLAVEASCHVQAAIGGSYLTFSPGCVYLSDDESLADPQIENNSHLAEAELDIRFSRVTGKWLWGALVGGTASGHSQSGSVGLNAARLVGSVIFKAEAGWLGAKRHNQAFATISLIF